MTPGVFTARETGWDVIAPNLTITIFGLLTFAAVIFLLFVIGERSSVKAQEWVKYLVFLVPALFLLTIGLIYPAIRTLFLSFMDARGETFIGFDNYIWAFTKPEILVVLRNTIIWTLAVPIFSTTIGLGIAYFTDRMKRGAWVKSLI
ncbi:MAG: sugar ABC transporter permease, partial [Aquiluna sp.]